MTKKKDNTPDRFKTELGGMELYGTTSNREIAGYMTSGDIENAGQIDKGFKKLDKESGSSASLVDSNPGDG